MAYQSLHIGEVVEELNKSYFLPGIQREYVWTEDQVCELFDSIMQDYPIGAFFFWIVEGERAQDQVKYKFIKHYVTDEVYPNSFHNRNYHNNRVDDEYDSIPDKLTLVLDGQQRLTALYIGLKGSISDRKPNLPRKKETTWFRKKLYLDLFHDRDSNDERGHRYKLEFKEPNRDVAPDEYWLESSDEGEPSLWFEVGDILDVDSYRDIDPIADKAGQQLDGAGYDSGVVAVKERTARNVLEALYRGLFHHDTVNYHREVDAPHARIHEIFLRLNGSGTDLTKEEELLSLLMASWAYAEEDTTDARKEINEFQTRLNRRYDGEFEFNLRWMLRTLLALSDSPLTFTKETFTDKNFSDMKETWEEEKFEKSILNGLDVIQSFGFDGKALRSNNIAIPVIYYFYKNWPVSAEWDNQIGQQNLKNILQFTSSVAINAVYSMKSVTVMRAIFEAIDGADGDIFPLKAIQKSLLGVNQSLALDRDRLEEFLRGISYSTDSGKGRAKLVLSLLSYPEVAKEHTYEIDHIFPRDVFRKRNLKREGFDDDEIDALQDLQHSIANLQLLTKQENAQKQNMNFDDWLQTRASQKGYLEKNAIPQDSSYYKINKFDKFCEKRTELVLDKLTDEFGTIR